MTLRSAPSIAIKRIPEAGPANTWEKYGWQKPLLSLRLLKGNQTPRAACLDWRF